MILLIFVTLLSLIFSAILVFGTYRTYVVQTSTKQTLFVEGKIPSKAPDGVYKGSVGQLKTNWIGKSLNIRLLPGVAFSLGYFTLET